MKLASLLSICRLEKSRGQSREGVKRIFKDFGQLLVSKMAHLKLVDKGCVLFFVIHPNHVRFLKPLVKELDSSRIAYRVVAYSPQVGDTLTKNEIEFEPFWLFSTFKLFRNLFWQVTHHLAVLFCCRYMQSCGHPLSLLPIGTAGPGNDDRSAVAPCRTQPALRPGNLSTRGRVTLDGWGLLTLDKHGSFQVLRD